jgi:hypothetical protein
MGPLENSADELRGGKKKPNETNNHRQGPLKHVLKIITIAHLSFPQKRPALKDGKKNECNNNK